MSDRTLADELRSVMAAHSLDAPPPDRTVDRVLGLTLRAGGAEPAPATARRLRPWLLAGTAAVVLALAGTGLLVSRPVGSPAPGSSAQAGSAGSVPRTS
ncbi:MAG TPA: hypothetical protein VHO01_13250, partial [Jatrophihabitans sp.]|nr:hypothetical protein [Jatrophihabitans sp.]